MHVISNIDILNKTGTCAICGAVKLRKKVVGERVYWTCLKHERETKKKWLQTPKGKISSKQSDWKKRNGSNLPEAAIAKYRTATHCECCGEPRSNDKPNDFVIDHCHKTGVIRGNICNRCNLTIGFFNDSTEILGKVIAYLKRGIKPAIVPLEDF